VRILLISKKYVPAAGGAQKSIHALLLAAVARGHLVEALVQAQPEPSLSSGPVLVRRIQNESEISAEVDRIGLPDLILTQIDWSHAAVSLARAERIPVVHFSRVGDLILDADLVVFNSHYVQHSWLRVYPAIQEYSLVLHPTISRADLGPAQPSGPAVLAVNPVRAKGGHLVAALAQQMCDTQFIATRGWCDPAADGVHLEHLPNLALIAPEDGIAPLARSCFALVFPSVWEEPFGRVAVEAMGAGLPVIAARRGGLPEALGGAGILLDPDADAAAWKAVLRTLQPRGETFRREREAGIARALRYASECDPAPLFHRIEELRRNYAGPRLSSSRPAPHANGEWFANLSN